MQSLKLEDIINYIESDIVILKMDIEGFECKALQPNILLNKLGKFIPYIFMEWKHLPNNKRTCPHFSQWVQNFYEGGYIPFNPGEYKNKNREHNDLRYNHRKHGKNN